MHREKKTKRQSEPTEILVRCVGTRLGSVSNLNLIRPTTLRYFLQLCDWWLSSFSTRFPDPHQGDEMTDDSYHV